MDGRDDHVRSLVTGIFEEAIEEHDGETAERQTERDQRVGGAEIIDGDQRVPEAGSDDADNQADAGSDDQPFDHCFEGKETAGDAELQVFQDCFMRHEADFRFIMYLEPETL